MTLMLLCLMSLSMWEVGLRSYVPGYETWDGLKKPLGSGSMRRWTPPFTFQDGLRLTKAKNMLLICSLIRESWRRKQFDGFMKSDRRDARALQGFVYSEARVKALRNSVLTSHSLAALTGASVSPACFGVQTNSSACTHTCPWCASQQVVADATCDLGPSRNLRKPSGNCRETLKKP